MPFGLTNAPRIFQRAMDDILREQVGKAFISKTLNKTKQLYATNKKNC